MLGAGCGGRGPEKNAQGVVAALRGLRTTVLSGLQVLGAKALMRKAACDGRKIEGLVEGLRAGLMEVAVAFKLCLKHRKGLVASGYGMERESTPRVEGAPGLETELGESTGHVGWEQSPGLHVEWVCGKELGEKELE